MTVNTDADLDLEVGTAVRASFNTVESIMAGFDGLELVRRSLDASDRDSTALTLPLAYEVWLTYADKSVLSTTNPESPIAVFAFKSDALAFAAMASTIHSGDDNAYEVRERAIPFNVA